MDLYQGRIFEALSILNLSYRLVSATNRNELTKQQVSKNTDQ